MSDGMLRQFQTSPAPNEKTQFHIFSSESNIPYLRVQIDVVAGSSLEQILGAGQQPYLYSIGLLQKARRSGTNLDSAAIFLLSTVSYFYWSLALIAPIESQDQQMTFCDKVWRLYMNFNLSISFAGQPATLSLVEPNFDNLTIRITLRVGVDENRHILNQGDIEGDSYNLSHRRNIIARWP